MEKERKSHLAKERKRGFGIFENQKNRSQVSYSALKG